MKLKFRSTCTINYTKELPLAQVNKELGCFLRNNFVPQGIKFE